MIETKRHAYVKALKGYLSSENMSIVHGMFITEEVIREIVSLLEEDDNLNSRYELIKCPVCGGKLEYAKIMTPEGMDGSSYEWEISCSGCGITKTYPADGFYGREYYTEEEMIL